MTTNPFFHRDRITNAEYFIGRWREMAVVTENMEAHRPVLIVGPPGIGKSSLLTHVAQSAAVILERPELEALYADLAVLDSVASFYRLVVKALGGSGDSPAAFELALIERRAPVLLCLDGAEVALAAGWGGGLLEALARSMRPGRSQGSSLLYLVVAAAGPAPTLSEPFATVTLGAVAATEVRLLADAYLDGSEISFTATELRELRELSAGHPAYLQRAAYHLFQAKTEPGYDWRSSYLAEARERPVPGAPLPPAVFQGTPGEERAPSAYGDPPIQQQPQASAPQPPIALAGLLAALLPLIVALVAWQLGANWLVTAAILLIGIVVAVVFSRREQ